jgi:hypothetical protein
VGWWVAKGVDPDSESFSGVAGVHQRDWDRVAASVG